MARVTIEECIQKVGSHFKVAQIAAHRAHQLKTGAKPKVQKENDKPVVIALREIEEGKIDETVLKTPIAEKDAWQKEEGLMIQSDDLGQAVADADSYSDINEVEDDGGEEGNVASQGKNSIGALSGLNSVADEESETDNA